MPEDVFVPVPSREKKWWAKNRVYPVRVQLDWSGMTAVLGPRTYRLLPQKDGGYIVALTLNGRPIEAGRFNESRVYRTLSTSTQRDLKVLRAVVYTTDYELVMAVRTDQGLTHSGACATHPGTNLYTVKDEDLEQRCLTCQEGFG